jgi:putative ABC transport system permease protein
MHILDVFQYSFDGLRRRKLRSWLTIVGIIIGVAAIVLLVSFGQALDFFVRDQLSFFGENTITISPIGGGFISKGTLTEKDFDAVKKLAGVEYASPIIQGAVPAQFKGDASQVYVLGFTTDFMKIYESTEIANGREFTDSESGAAVIGYTIANDFWGDAKKREVMQLGSKLILNNKSFTTIGILKKNGGLLSSIADIAVYVPYDQAREIIPLYKNNNQVTRIDIKVREGSNPNDVANEIKRVMDSRHRIKSPDERDYRVMTSEQIQRTVGSITFALSMFLLAISAISLLVGMIGVANTMFASVLERTREIGILKALGATDRSILSIFIFESALIGAVGGIIGVALSVMLVLTLSVILTLLGFSLPLGVSPFLALSGVGIAIFTGVASGYLPARRAAKMQAVDALRYE